MSVGLASFIGEDAALATENYVDARYGDGSPEDVINTLDGWIVRNTWLSAWSVMLQRNVTTVVVQYHDVDEPAIPVWSEREGWL